MSAPARCDPERGDPIAWIVAIARNKLTDAERAARRRWRREAPLTDEMTRRLRSPGQSPDELMDRRAWVAARRRQLIVAAKTEPERRFLAARLSGAPLAEQAIALGASDLPRREQRALAYRIWQRLRRRLLRRRKVTGERGR